MVAVTAEQLQNPNPERVVALFGHDDVFSGGNTGIKEGAGTSRGAPQGFGLKGIPSRRGGDDKFEILKYDWSRAMKRVM